MGQDKCVACSYIENDDGTISGNRNCQRDPPLSLEVDCPIYQSNGCYSASSVHEILDGNNEFIQKYETAKGCSYFRTLGDALEQVDQIIGMYRIKHLNRHVLEPTVIDICKPFLKINRKL